MAFTILLVLLLSISAALVVYTYVVYPIGMLIWARYAPRPIKSDPSFESPVSIILVAYNEERSIGRRLENLLEELHYPREKVEVLFASDASTDTTVTIAEEFASRDERLRIFNFPRRRGKNLPIDELVPQAKHSILIFTDADVIFHPDAVRHLVKNFSDETVGAVGGNFRFDAEVHASGARGERRYFSLELMLRMAESVVATTASATGSIIAVRRELVEPFGNAHTGDDVLTIFRVLARGYRVVTEPAAIAYERLTTTMRAEFRRKLRFAEHGLSAIQIAPPLHGFAFFTMFSHRLLRWLSPLYYLIFILSVIALAGKGFLWAQTLAIGMCAVLFLAGVGWAIDSISSEDSRSLPKIFLYPYFFVAMHVAVALGLWNALNGRITMKWERENL